MLPKKISALSRSGRDPAVVAIAAIARHQRHSRFYRRGDDFTHVVPNGLASTSLNARSLPWYAASSTAGACVPSVSYHGFDVRKIRTTAPEGRGLFEGVSGTE
jgi:hypothetical protein